MTGIGFTGTQAGLTLAQWQTLKDTLGTVKQKIFHHGDCIGADEQADSIAKALEFKIVIHPPVDSGKRAFCTANVMWAKKPYLERNHDIVDTTDGLIACPKEFEEVMRSGTWATIRYATKKGKPVFIIWPDGSTTRK